MAVAALIGFGAKAGAAPLHIWLPRAHPIAPTHVSALMSGVTIMIALYGADVLPVDLRIAGCPPAPAAIAAALLRLVDARRID